MERVAAARAEDRAVNHLEFAETGIVAPRPAGANTFTLTPAPATLNEIINAPVNSASPNGTYYIPGAHPPPSDRSDADSVQEVREAVAVINDTAAEQVRCA